MTLQTQKSPPKIDKANGKDKPALAPANEKIPPVDWAAFLAGMSRGKTVLEYGEGRTIFMQGDVADAVWYLQQGKVKHAVTSQQGKEAIVAVLGPGEFFGEGCLAGRPLRMATATTLTDCTLYKIEKQLMMRMLHEQHDISELFVTHLLVRNMRYQEDLVDQLFNSSEKRLARILLLLSHYGKEAKSRNHPSRNQSGTPGANGRHHPVAGQSFHEQVPHAGLYRLRGQRRVDG